MYIQLLHTIHPEDQSVTYDIFYKNIIIIINYIKFNIELNYLLLSSKYFNVISV